MKKKIICTVIVFCMCLPYCTNTRLKSIYACTQVELNDSQKSILNNYIKSIDSINKNIDLLGKSVLNQEEKGKEINEQYIKRIDSLIEEINEILKNVQRDYQENIKNTDLANYLLSISAILSNYKFALTQLKIYIQSLDYDIGYKSLGTFYIIMNDSNAQLNDIKLEIKD